MTTKNKRDKKRVHRGKYIEELIDSEQWARARAVIEKDLIKLPDDHWLWARLSSVKYEQRDYQGALADANKALHFMPTCPLAMWSKATALEMLDKIDQAVKVYLRLLQNGVRELKLKKNDDDAYYCWEGCDWTRSLLEDCLSQLGGCFDDMSK